MTPKNNEPAQSRAQASSQNRGEKSAHPLGRAATVALAALVAGCQTQAQNGALLGGAAGAGIGAIIGHNSHGRTADGALIGGAVGALGGAVVGHEMDKADARAAQAQAANPPANVACHVPAITKDDVINWTSAGTHEDIIIDRIERSGSIFHLTTADENQLRNACVSEEVIRVMKETCQR